jgi:hypothetical protein
VSESAPLTFIHFARRSIVISITLRYHSAVAQLAHSRTFSAVEHYSKCRHLGKYQQRCSNDDHQYNQRADQCQISPPRASDERVCGAVKVAHQQHGKDSKVFGIAARLAALVGDALVFALPLATTGDITQA